MDIEQFSHANADLYVPPSNPSSELYKGPPKILILLIIFCVVYMSNAHGIVMCQ